MKLRIDVITALEDNYIYVINNGQNAIVVDPGQYTTLKAYLHDHKIEHVDVLLTHGHHDHVAGLNELVADYPNAHIIGPQGTLESLQFTNRQDDKLFAVQPDNEFLLQGLKFFALDTPGHTKHHYTYLTGDCMFVGDLLSSVGCGRVQEDGDLTDLYISIDKVKSYAIQRGQNTQELLMFPGHEYTLENIRFAMALEDVALKPRLEKVAEEVINKLRNGVGNTPVNFYEELNYNPFLRAPSIEEFVRTRTVKDNFGTLVETAKKLEQAVIAQQAKNN